MKARTRRTWALMRRELLIMALGLAFAALATYLAYQGLMAGIDAIPKN